MSHRAGLEMFCTSDLQAEEPIAERSDGGSSERAQSPTEEADRVSRGRKETVVGGIQGELQISYFFIFLTAGLDARIGRSQSSDRGFAEVVRKHSSVCVQAEVG